MKRRDFLMAAPVACVPAVAMGAVSDAPADPMIALVARYIEIRRAWEDASYLDGEGNFDGPVTSTLEAEKDAMEAQLRALPIQTPEGFAAFVRYVHVDNYMGEETNVWPDMPGWAWEKIVGWVDPRILIGGAA